MTVKFWSNVVRFSLKSQHFLNCHNLCGTLNVIIFFNKRNSRTFFHYDLHYNIEWLKKVLKYENNFISRTTFFIKQNYFASLKIHIPIIRSYLLYTECSILEFFKIANNSKVKKWFKIEKLLFQEYICHHPLN